MEGLVAGVESVPLGDVVVTAAVVVGPDVVVDADRLLEHPTSSATAAAHEVIVRFLMATACACDPTTDRPFVVTFAPRSSTVGSGI